MPNWWQVAIPIGAVLLASVLNAWINIHVKFAQTRDEAIRSLMRIVLAITSWVAVAWTVWLLFVEISSSAPVTRSTVFAITSEVASLTFVLVIKTVDLGITAIWKAVHATNQVLIDTAATLGEHMAVTRADILSRVPPSELR